MFQVNRMVVCVDDKPNRDGVPPLVKVQGIYTVTGFGGYTQAGNIRLKLLEVGTPAGYLNNGYSCVRFRPIREQSIEIFREIARGVRERVGAAGHTGA